MIEDIEAENGTFARIFAINKVLALGQQMDAYSVIDQEAEEEIQSCEVCGGDILPDTAYTTAEDDNYSVCEKCSKEAQNEG